VNESQDGDKSRLLTLLTNGKFQGNNSMGGEMQAQVGFALSPLLHTTARDRALVIGFGTGVSARTLNAAGFRQLDVVDLSADIIRLADTHFYNVNDHVIRKPNVTTYVTDGRNFLLLQDRKYDVVSMEISSIWFAGAASLYNREFYQLAKRRMPEHGVLQQWMQLHHASSTDILYILGSVRAEFRYVWLYLIGGQGMIIASNDAKAQPDLRNVAALDATAGLKPLLALHGGSAASLLKTRLLDPAGTDKLLDSTPMPISYWVSTDDNLFLEYSTPRGNVLDGARSYAANIDFIRVFANMKAVPR
jgi:spermidine synthase